MYYKMKYVADINRDYESLLKNCIEGEVILSAEDNSLYTKIGDEICRISEFTTPPNKDSNVQSAKTLKTKELKVYKCPSCGNSVHYLQTECEFCRTKISWI